jgi:hypothetical protein
MSTASLCALADNHRFTPPAGGPAQNVTLNVTITVIPLTAPSAA